MMPLDRALAERARAGWPVRVALVGPGFMGRMLVRQIARHVPGLRIVAVAGRTATAARAALDAVGLEAIEATRADEIDEIVSMGRRAVIGDPVELARAGSLDVLVEATGDVEVGAAVVLTALSAGTDVVLVNAELDALLGPLLAERAREAGRLLTGADGDEPGIAMNLVRLLTSFGLEPVLAGNLKGFFDRYRTPDTQAEFAGRMGIQPEMATAFADGTKLSVESAVLANATGFGVERRGMVGYRCDRVEDVLSLLPTERLLGGSGLVDFALGAAPGSGAFAVARPGRDIDAAALAYCKMGDGPLYLIHQPFHIPHLAMPLSVARLALFRDATVAAAGLACEVVAIAKRDLRAGEVLDGPGGFACYGEIENATVSVTGELLPIGLARGSRLLVDVARDEPIALTDVERPQGRLVDRLHAEQRRLVVSGC